MPIFFFTALSLAPLALQRQNCVVGTETIWPAKLKIFGIWPFTEKVYRPRFKNVFEKKR